MDPITGLEWKIRAGDKTLVLWIRSERMERIFERLASGKKTAKIITPDQLRERPTLAWLLDKQAWAVDRLALPSDKWRFGSLHEALTANGLNYRLFTLVGLKDGIEIPLEAPMSRSMGKLLAVSIDACCREIFEEYAKPLNLSGTINLTERAETT